MNAKAGILERRLYPRSEVAAIATLFFNNRCHGPYPVSDLSASGTRLRVGIPLEWTEPLELTLRFSDGHSITTSARWVRDRKSREQEESSFCFVHESPDLEDAIHQAILSQLEKSRPDRTVLVADSSLETCVAIRQELQTTGRAVVFAQTPLDAICWMENRRVKIDTVLVNLKLGEVSGSGLLDYLIEEHPRVHRVLMSDGTHDWQGDLATRTGRAHSYLSKPWSRKKLLALFD